MKNVLGCVVIISLSCASIACADGLSVLALPGVGAWTEQVKVNPYAQVGFQRLGSNLSLPVDAQLVNPSVGALEIATMDLSLQDANFWTGTAGVNVTLSKMYSFSASAGGILPRQFIAAGQIPVSVNGIDASATIDFTADKVESWFIQSGGGLGPILLGLYWAHFTFDVGDPRQGSTPLANQTLRGYLVTKTFAPYIGFAMPVNGALFTVIYSPIASFRTALALRTSQRSVAELAYRWTKPGNFVSSTVQYNVDLLGSASFGLWANYSWMNVRGNAELEFQDSATAVYRQKNVTATLTSYVVQGGVALAVAF